MDTSKPINPWDIVEASAGDIAKLTHRHIHALFKRWRTVGWTLRDWEEPEYGERMYMKATAILQAELARRPHVPNKKESKALRQAAAKAGR